MKTNTQEPELIKDDPTQGQTFSHPAFGQISANRVTGGTTLYGSDFEHRAFIELQITRSDLIRSISHDWHFNRDQIVTIRLSEAQWATFVSSLNVGGGVPCTLQRVAREEMPKIPLRTEREVASNEVVKRAMEMGDRVTDTIAAIEGELGASISKKRRTEILLHLKTLEQDLNANVEYYVNSFEKHMENTVEKAKIEVGAYVQSTLQRVGLEALGSAPISLLSSSESTEEE